MPNPGDKLYRINTVRFIARQNIVQVEVDTYVVDADNNNIPTGSKAVRLPWNGAAFDAAKAAVAAATAADPILAGFTAV